MSAFKLHYRATIFHDIEEIVYFDFSLDADADAMEYAQDKGFGEVAMLSRLPLCFSPYQTSYKPAQNCDGRCPYEATDDADDTLGPDVLPGGGKPKLGGIRNTVFGCCPMDSDAWGGGVNKGVIHFFKSLFRKKDQLTPVKVFQHKRFNEHLLPLHALEALDEKPLLTAVTTDTEQKPSQVYRDFFHGQDYSTAPIGREDGAS